MKAKVIFFPAIVLVLISLNSCYVDHEYYEPHVELVNVDEYETKEVLYQEYDRGQLVYEEAIYEAWMDIEIYNAGSEPARNVKIEVTILGYPEYHDYIHVGWLSPGEYTTLSYYTGYEFTSDYDGYDISLYWE